MDSSNKNLDLRLDGQLSLEHSKLLDNLIETCIDDFNNFNEEFIEINDLIETDLFLSISSRDTSANTLTYVVPASAPQLYYYEDKYKLPAIHEKKYGQQKLVLLTKNEYEVLLSLLKLNFSFPFTNIIESPTCVKAAYTAVSLLTIFSIFTVVSSSLGPNTSTRVKS